MCTLCLVRETIDLRNLVRLNYGGASGFALGQAMRNTPQFKEGYHVDDCLKCVREGDIYPYVELICPCKSEFS